MSNPAGVRGSAGWYELPLRRSASPERGLATNYDSPKRWPGVALILGSEALVHLTDMTPQIRKTCGSITACMAIPERYALVQHSSSILNIDVDVAHDCSFLECECLMRKCDDAFGRP